MSRRRARRAAKKAATETTTPPTGETKETSPDAPSTDSTNSSSPSLPTPTPELLLPTPTKHKTLEEVLKGMEPTLLDYAVASIQDIEDLDMMEPNELVEALIAVASAILISSEFCTDKESASKYCQQLATVVLLSVEEEKEEAGSLAWMNKTTLVAGYANLPTISNEASKFLMMGEQKKTNVEVMGTMDKFLDENSGAAKKRQRREAKEREKLRQLRIRVLAISESIREQEEEAIRKLPSRLEAVYVGDLSISNYTLSTPDGQVLADDCNINMVQGRKYGLCGRNGIGKTTLLRAIASRDIENMPSNLRCLHVSQEVHGDELSVLDTIVTADFELMTAKKEEEDMSNDPNHEPTELAAVG